MGTRRPAGRCMELSQQQFELGGAMLEDVRYVMRPGG
jgi:hypothetical protein